MISTLTSTSTSTSTTSSSATSIPQDGARWLEAVDRLFWFASHDRPGVETLQALANAAKVAGFLSIADAAADAATRVEGLSSGEGEWWKYFSAVESLQPHVERLKSLGQSVTGTRHLWAFPLFCFWKCLSAEEREAQKFWLEKGEIPPIFVWAEPDEDGLAECGLTCTLHAIKFQRREEEAVHLLLRWME